MIDGFTTLLWLQWKRFKTNTAYWLRLVGFEQGASRIYHLYIAFFWLVWLGMMWIFVVEQAWQISQLLSPADAGDLQQSIPPLIFVAQLWYLIILLRDSPLKFGAGDIAYVAASPAGRTGIVFIHFIGSLLLPVFSIGIVSCLVAMILTWPTSPMNAGFAGLRGMVLGWLLFLFTAAALWTVALLKMSLLSRNRKWLMWLAVPVSIGLALAFPAIMFYPGVLWLNAVNTSLTIQTLAISLVLLAAALWLLAMVGNHVNMTTMVDDSWTYARIHKLGIFGQMYNNDVVTSVRRQSRLLRKKRLRLKISEQAVGYPVILNRALLSLFRFAPGSIFRPLFRGMALTGTAMLVIQISGAQHLQTWILLLILFIFLRPLELNALFQQDIGQPFTRQFLPPNLLMIVLADSIIPILLATVGGLSVFILRPIEFWAVVPLIFSLFVGLAFCQALEWVVVPRPIFRRIPYPYSVVFSGIVLVAFSYLFRSLPAVAIAALSLNVLFAIALYGSSLTGDEAVA